MKKLVLLLVTASVGLAAQAQKSKIEDALRQMDKNPPNISLALEYINDAKNHPETQSESKTYRAMGEIYMALAATKDSALKAQYPNPAYTGIESYIKCMELNTSRFEYKTAENYLFARSGITGAYNLARAAYENKKFGDALMYFELLIRAIPFDEDGVLKSAGLTIDYMHLLAAQSAHVDGNTKKAIEHYNKVLEYNNRDQDAYIAMSQINLEAKDTAAAFAIVKKGRDLMPDSTKLREREIDLYIITGRIGEMEAEVNEAIKNDPNNALLYSLRGDIYDSKDEPEKAIADYEKAIELSPDNSLKAHNNLGAQYLKMAKPLVEKYNSDDVSFEEASALEDQINELYKKAIPHFIYVKDNATTDKIKYDALVTLRDLYKDTKDVAKYRATAEEIRIMEQGTE